MKSLYIAITLVILIFSGCNYTTSDPHTKGISLVKLRSEYLDNPVGIDVKKPRFSWQIQVVDDTRGCKQSAYQILVASSQENLDNNIGNLWDSKKVSSNKSVLISYDGTALTSGTKCYWKTKVWTNEDKETAWSKTAFFSMGLLEENDWMGSWINYPDTTI